MTDSVIDRLDREHRFPDVLEDLLGVKVPADKTKAIRCLHPNLHKNGDAHPSMIVQPTSGGVSCSCGLSMGLLDLVVEKGFAADTPSAAKWLEERYYGARGGNGHPAPDPPREWPYYPNTAAKLGWEVTEDKGVPALRCPTHAADGTPLRTKIRRKKAKDVPAATFLEDGTEIGLLGVPQALEATDSAETPTLALLAGETDLLAWTWHAKHEGIPIHGLSSAKGETSGLGEDAAVFRGAKVIVLYDADATGREQGPKRAAEALAAGALSAVSIHVPSGKDVCEYLLAGGTVRELLRLAEQAAKPTKPLLATVTLRQVLDAPLEEPDWFVPGLLGRKRMTILTAAPKTGKSAAALGIAFRLAAGMSGTWLGQDYSAIGYRDVLYLSAEGGPRLIQQRYKLLTTDLPSGWEESFRLLLARPWPRLDSPEGLAVLRATLDQTPADLLVIDPLARFRDLEGENDNAVTQAFAENLRSVVEDKNLACLLVHHPSKAGASDREGTSYYGGRGASALFGEVDAAISLRKDPKSGEIHAYYELRDSEPIEPGRRLSLNKDTLWLDCLGDLGAVSQTKSPVRSEDVLNALRGCGAEGHPWAQVYNLIGASKSSWFRERGRVFMELAGKIRIGGSHAFAV